MPAGSMGTAGGQAQHPRLWAAWARQLQAEYRGLVAAHRLRGLRATLRIGASQRFLGHYEPDTQLIVIAEALIWAHPWWVVVEVLKHEMAHQLTADEAAGAAPHGAAFARACRRLGVAPWARGAEVEAPLTAASLVPAALGPDPRAARLGKLLALAESDNPHEAGAAAAQARRLAERLGPGPSGSDGTDADAAVDVVQLTRRRRQIGRVEAQLVGLVARHFAVEAIFVPTFDAVACSPFMAVEFLGAPGCLPLAAHAYFFLWEALERGWGRFAPPGARGGRGRRQAFMLGALDAIDRRWAAAGSYRAGASRQAAPTTATAAQGALLPSDRALRRHLAAALGRRHPQRTRLDGRAAGLDATAFAAGAEAGEQVEVFVPLARDRRRPAALPARRPGQPGPPPGR